LSVSGLFWQPFFNPELLIKHRFTRAFLCLSASILFFANTPSAQSQIKPAQDPINYSGSDLALIISEALETSPLVKSQLGQAQAARSGVNVAKWQFYPTPTATYEQVRTGQNDPSYPTYGSNHVYRFGAQQPIWAGGRISAGLSVAENQLLATLADLELTKERVALSAIQDFSDWYAAHHKVIAFKSNVEVHRKLLGLISRRIDSGISPKSDFVFANGRLEQALIELSLASTQEDVARIRLGQLVGRPVSEVELAKLVKIFLQYLVNGDELLQNALEGSPLIAKAKAQLEIQETQVSLAKSSLSPSVSLRIERQNGDYGYSNYVSPPQTRAFISVSSTFGAGLSNYSQISGATAKRDAAISDQEVVKRGLSESILSDIVILKNQEYRILASKSAVEAARSTSESWARQFLAGKKAWQDLLNATRELAASEANLADANSASMVVRWRLAITSWGLGNVLDLSYANLPSNRVKN